MKKEISEEDAMKELQSKQSLGKVDMTKGSHIISGDDEEVKRLNMSIGYIDLPVSVLPSGGRFYRDDFTLSIRAARVGEIRNFSTIDEDDLSDVDQKLNEILISCLRVNYGTAKGSYKDLLEEDRIYVILSIRELTFKDGESKIMMPISKMKCKSGECKQKDSIELRTENLQCNTPGDIIEKYYDQKFKCYSVETKNFGVITLAPPTIGVMRCITDYIKERESEGKPWDKSSIQIIPYIIREWRGLSSSDIFNIITDLHGWSSTKFSLIYRLTEQIKVGIKTEFVYECADCGAEVTVPLSFPGGIKSLFIIQDISSELL